MKIKVHTKWVYFDCFLLSKLIDHVTPIQFTSASLYLISSDHYNTTLSGRFHNHQSRFPSHNLFAFHLFQITIQEKM